MNKILITAFEPFGGKDTNSSLEVLKLLPDTYKKVALPVEYIKAKTLLCEEIAKNQPDFVLSLGQAEGDFKIRIEKFGLNYTRARIPDNSGVIRKKGRVNEENKTLAYETKIDVEALSDNLNSIVPCYLSLSAGGFICNTVYYTALEQMASNALFIHLPLFEGQIETDKPTMKLDDMERAINHILEFIK